jgi:hypothetical protein
VTTPPAVDLARRHLALGVGIATARGARRVPAALFSPARLAAPLADTIWHSTPMTPARRVIRRELAQLASLGERGERDLRRRLGTERERLLIATLEQPELERLIAAALDSPATDRIVRRVLQSPGVERAVVQVLDSQLLLDSTERALRTEEVQRIVERIAGSREVRDAIVQQSAGLADVVAQETRRRSASADDRVERMARTVLRRNPRNHDGNGR